MQTSSSICVQITFLVLFAILISSGDATPRVQKLCPVVLPDGTPSRKDPNKGQYRIVNGDLATGLKTYMGALKSSSELICSATLLSEYWALTAAHCRFFPRNTTFVTGGERFDNGVEIEIEKMIVHELFSPRGAKRINDIQLIKLKTAAPRTANFVKLNTNSSIPASLSFVRTAGYGETLETAVPTHGLLRQVDIPVQPINICKKQYVEVNINPRYHVCAGYTRGGCDSCFGDSGGPLLAFDEGLNVVQVGIVSFGIGCAMTDASGVYSRVSSHIDWLREKGAVFQTSSSGIDVFADPETGAPLTNGTNNVSGNLSAGAETESTQAEVENEESGFPAPTESVPPEVTESDSSGDGLSSPTRTESVSPEVTESASAEDDASSIPTGTESVSSEVTESANAGHASSSSSAGECFPGMASVALEDGSKKQMRDLQIGDSVQVGPGTFSKVFMFTHRIAEGKHKFVNITNSYSNEGIMLTAGHLMAINGVYKQAGMAKRGDILELGDGRKAEVLRVEEIWGSGLYNPQTIGGRIVVNGVVVSTYTRAMEINTAHAVLAPLRSAFMMFGRDFSGGALEDGFRWFSV